MENEVDRLLTTYERGHLTRRELLAALAAVSISGPSLAGQSRQASVLRASNFNHLSVNVSDLRRSAEFYQKLFGLGPALRSLTPPGSNTYGLDFNGQLLSLRLSKERLGEISHFCFGVDNFDAKRDGAALRASGLARDVRESPEWGWLTLRDPDGVSVQVADTKLTAECRQCPPPPV